MEKTTLKLHEFYSLEAELAGLTQRGEDGSTTVITKGLLSENVKMVVKYWLTDCLKKVTAEKEAVDKLREEIIKRIGVTAEDGTVSIPRFIFKKDEEGKDTQEPESLHPDYLQFEKEYNELLQEDRTLEHFAFSLDHFSNVESGENYPTFFKLIKVAE